VNSRSLSLPPWLTSKRFILGLLTGLAIAASIQSLVRPHKTYTEGGLSYPCYNNYTIFKQSFYHLIHHQDLYVLYPDEHWDLFKYTPTFAFLFGGLAVLPDTLGLNLWNLLNALILAFAVYSLPKLSNEQKGWILLACAIEAMTAMQNEQSNGLIAGLLIFSFTLCERGKFIWAAGCIILATFIKPFGIVGLALLLFYPRKVRHLDNAILWSVVCLILPLIVISPAQLVHQYQGWLTVLQADQSQKYGFSVAGWLHTWFNYDPGKMVVVGIGALLFVLPMFRFSMYQHYRFKLMGLASILIWVVIFNHMAESPTFIIALAGASIWFFSKKPSILDIFLFALVVVVTSIFTTDIIPHNFQQTVLRPYVIKAVPCILVWLKIIFDMMRLPKSAPESLSPQPS
jgi:hypothetical protein